MRKNFTIGLCVGLVTLCLLTGCAQQEVPVATTEAAMPETVVETEPAVAPIPDGLYSAKFDTDSSMFHTSEACEGRGTLTVENGQMTLHVSLASQKILNLYLGLADDAIGDEANWLQPSVDTVTYSDGLTEEVFGFDVPVAALNTEFDLALVGTKGTWYDHKVVVSDPQPINEENNQTALVDGEYSAEATLIGGTGKTTIENPTKILVENGQVTAVIVLSSTKYDYMLLDGEKYLNEAAEGEKSTFTLPVADLSAGLEVIGDTIAMSTPHEIEYTITFTINQ